MYYSIYLFYCKKQFILSPVELRPQCGRNWIHLIKLTTPLQLSNRKACSIFRLKLLCQVLQQVRTILSSFLSLLFCLQNTFTDTPVHLHTTKVHTASRILPRRGDYLPHLIIEILNITDHIPPPQKSGLRRRNGRQGCCLPPASGLKAALSRPHRRGN